MILTVVLCAPPLSGAACLCKMDGGVYGHDNDEGWLREVGLHGGFPAVFYPHPQHLVCSACHAIISCFLVLHGPVSNFFILQ
jgi:hypothetical protein